METNWIIIGIILVAAIALVIYLVYRNQKDKEEVIKTFNAETSTEEETEGSKDEV
ncbi:MAG: FeoB-associated Cys-rich membrane protein [Paludibacter sp.]|nr:FeoB-associated Cys-rich membrane protein [Paludibacter sp.]